MKITKRLPVTLAVTVILLSHQLATAQPASQKELARVHPASPEAEIMSFNERSQSLGLPPGQFVRKVGQQKSVVFSNGKQLSLDSDLERAMHVSKDYVIVVETDHPSYPRFYKQHVYDNQGNELFSLQSRDNFFLYPTGTGLFIRKFERGKKGLVVFNAAGDSVTTIRDATRVSDFRKIYASPDKSYFVINVEVPETQAMIDHPFNARGALLAFSATGDELWRISGLYTSSQLGISHDKVAIGAWGGQVLVFSRSGDKLHSYAVKYNAHSAVAFDETGKYLAAISSSRRRSNAPISTSYIYLFDDQSRRLLSNWPVVVRGTRKGIVRAIRLDVLDNAVVVAFATHTDERIYRAYHFSGELLLETSTINENFDDVKVPEISYNKGYLQIFTSSAGWLLELK